MLFREFTELFVGLDTPLGDLARDIKCDPNWEDLWDPLRVDRYLQRVLHDDEQKKLASALVQLYRFGVY